MLSRLTISALLKSVIAVMAACVVAFLITTAWDSWGRLQSAARISVIAEASGNAFRAMPGVAEHEFDLAGLSYRARRMD